VVGVDDFAWKRGHRYGTIICDLERRCIIDILPDREAATTTAWLAGRPSITIIARDRGAGYKQAATEGRPDAVQVADRWHLMENASAAFLTAVQRSMITIRKGVGAGIVDPAALSAAERHQGGFAVSRRMPISWRFRLRAWQSKRSCGEPTNHAGSCAKWCAVRATTSSAAG
jgi:transposase